MAACKTQPPAPAADSSSSPPAPEAVQEALQEPQRPATKLIVGLVIDQMRPEYLTRFAQGFTEGGFKRLMREGFVNYNTHYNYIPTFTGPGHASIFSGATPATHGIIGNNWYSREEARSVYCAGDPDEKPVGSETGMAASPHRLLVTNLADELKLATNRRAKVVGVSLKDRSAVMPAGHIPDGAYWYDKTTGRFITSTYYMEQLPGWMQQFNGRQLAKQYLDSTWTLLLPEAAYQNSGPDNQPYERVFAGRTEATFPYVLPELQEQNGGYDILSSTPWGNTLVTEIALAALAGEGLGQDETPDLFTVSYSTPDIIGHDFGLRSRELHDMYLRLDREIARLLDALDAQVGEGNYMLFLTADHAAADVPQFLMDERLPAGYYPEGELKAALNKQLQQRFKQQELVEYITNDQVYLNHTRIRAAKLHLEEVQAEVVNYLVLQPYTVDAYTGSQMRQNEYSGGIRHLLQMGYYRPRSGDVLLVLNPAWMHKISYATTHGSGYTYDTHVPLIWYGNGIKRGGSYRYQAITDIAPTVSQMLGIGLPNGATGSPILEVLE
ncbi:Alkaline phosphatase precursor [Cesiribacter andamanensis AMV16]|uniref:Alkaline phosphatase n=2 Tax=Cesiribacter TaxID=1133570 RepID=M7NR70_9BACT|nr:Alkaline phosphatase precursor [Cesiribacter andamanensis AMV16]